MKILGRPLPFAKPCPGVGIEVGCAGGAEVCLECTEDVVVGGSRREGWSGD